MKQDAEIVFHIESKNYALSFLQFVDISLNLEVKI